MWRLGADRAWRRFKLLNSTATELGRCLFEDAEGNLWVGTGGSGLLRIKAAALKTYYARDGLASDVVRSVTQDRDGTIWLATVDSVDCFAPGGAARAQQRARGRVLPWTVYGDRSGALWVGEFASGAHRYRGDNVEGFGIASWSAVNVIFEDRQGGMHFGTPVGLHRIEGRSLVPVEGQPQGPLDVRAIAEDHAGQLYLGLNGSGLLRKGKDGWKRFTTENGLPGNHVWTLYVDEEDAVWIGVHGHGLSRLREGKFFNFASSELPRLITCIIEDDLGHLWLGSNQGLFRVERRQLNQFANGQIASLEVMLYDRTEGMGSSQCTADRQPTAWKACDGKLWFATMKGVTVVDPRSLPLNTRPPPVVVEGVFIDDRPVAADTFDVKVPATADRLEFRYAGLSFTAPDRVRFRYRLQGFDKDWLNANNRRTAYYTKVPPGTYRFEVLACNNNNIWNNTGAAMGVIVMPHFWQTGWFRLVAFFGLGGFVFGLYELRVLRLKRERVAHETFSRRLLESQENERKRMAAELHDSLGQSLLVMKNYAFMALKDTATPSKVREQLQEISESASASIDEVRSIARALRPYQLDRFGLTKTLEDAAELVAKTGSLQIATSIDDVDDVFSADAEISIYRVVQEWLNNVVKHARAATARITVRKEAEWVRLLLEDDGIGFDYAAVMNQSRGTPTFGLANLRERIHLLRGTLKLESAPGKGTRLFVEIPCKE
jgi:signal transduction histidine kinase